ncbi:MAG: hypothetical protein ACYSWZ_11100 [Planctomycetota bacterium]|jgi:hypothetical protein
MITFNKIAIIAALLVMLGALTGCGIGYNKTLFLTKSNVGLDASAAPKPTFDLALSRFEGVITPGFEKGKKLPVLASFRFKNKDRISPAVGSTYAAGDAAIAMAALFGDDTVGKDANNRLTLIKSKDNIYDSMLKLDNKPVIKKGLLETWFPGIFHPQEFQTEFVEPVIFGTDTSLGLKVAWSTAPAPPAPFPDSVKFGYNRTEIGLAPITMNNNDGKFNMKMASLLATADTGVAIDEADSQVKLEHIQYFATGKAATLLALQQEVRKAMLARLDPNAKYYAKRFAALMGESKAIAIAHMSLIYDGLDTLASNPSVSTEIQNRAVFHHDALDSLANLLPDKYTFTHYTFESETNYTVIDEIQIDQPISRENFNDVVVYLSNIYGAIEVYEEMLKVDRLTVNGKQPKDLKDTIIKHRDSAIKAGSDIKSIEQNPSLIAAAEWYINTVFGR